jgi:Ca2+:H+ antiporter
MLRGHRFAVPSWKGPSTAKRVSWTAVAPLIALVSLVFTWGQDIGPVVGLVAAVLLGGAVLAAVHHAEVVAHRVGEPFGSLVLAVG